MTKFLIWPVILIFFLNRCNAQHLEKNAHLKLIGTIPLKNVSGRMDHLTFDVNNQKVFIAARGNNTLEVVDLKINKVLSSIKNQDEPQGIVCISESKAVVVANGGTGECIAYSTDSYQKINSLKLPDDADNVRYDSINKLIYVGYGDGGIASIDANTFKLVSDIKLTGHPESFQLDPDAKKIFVNVPDKRLIEVIDVEKKKVTEQWKVTAAGSNFPMSFDYVHHRLFIGCRHPAKMLVLDSQSGEMITSIEIDSDVDDIFYDTNRKLIFLSCGAGYVDIINQTDSNTYSLNSKISTRSGARTSLLVPELNRYFVASPSGLNSQAELLIYEVK